MPFYPKLMKTARNTKLLKDYLSHKYTIYDLVVKYQISSTRIHYLVKQFKDNKGQFEAIN